MSKNLKLYLIIPCYNEEDVLPLTSELFLEKIISLISKGLISDESRILFVNDGSSDSTWDIIKELSLQDKHYIGISQSRNRGHQNALMAGLMEARNLADITISVDCDGQDDIDAIDEMINAYQGGFDVVYGVRQCRDTDTFFKRFTAEVFYKLLNFLCEGGVVFNHADYRLLSSKVLYALSEFTEVNLFLRGLIPLVGFKNTCVYYSRRERVAGKTHYPLKKMVDLAIEGITSLSTKPLRMIKLLGLLVSTCSLVGIVWAFISYLVGSTVASWTSLVCVVCFLSGVQLISLGIIAEYVGKAYLETKRRPRYIISERTYPQKISNELNENQK